MTGTKRSGPFRWRHETVIGILLVVLLAVAEYFVPGFLKLQSQLLLSRQLWETAILSLGMTLIMITGGIDLSVGAIMGLSAVTFGMCHAATGNVSAATTTAAVTGLMCGLINGLLIARVRVHSLIITLATLAAYRGIAEGLSEGRSWSQFGDSFSLVARGSVLGLPLPGCVFLVLAVGFAVFLNRTAAGRFLYATGHNELAARFSGVNVDGIRLRLYGLSGLLSGMAAIVYIARFDTAKADAGRGFELDVITAVVVGGTSIAGGRGSVTGTVLGLLLIHETRLFVSRYWRIDELRSIVVGCLLIVSVLLAQSLNRRR